MKINLQNLFRITGERLDIECEMPVEAGMFSDDPALSFGAAKISCHLKNSADSVSIKFCADVIMSCPCDRCSESTEIPVRAEFSGFLVTRRQSEEDDRLIMVENYQIDLFELCTEALILELPMKRLCSDECKGLCGRCGWNLNKGNCECAPFS